MRSEEHTSELQSRLHLVCRLLLDPATTEFYTLSLHDALPISSHRARVCALEVGDHAVHEQLRVGRDVESIGGDLVSAGLLELQDITAAGACEKHHGQTGPIDEIGRAHV